MAASYPGALKTFTTKAAGGAILSAHVNDLQDEVAAVETQLGVNAGTLIAYTPVITGSTTNPTIGDGTLTGHYTKIGKYVHAWVYWLFGSTTDKGSGTYYISYPTAASSSMANYTLGTWQMYHSSIHYSGLLRYNTTVKGWGTVDGATWLSSTSPYSPAAGTYYKFEFSYVAA